ncbi:hypothetical protein [Nocardia sp. NPDC024068]|uniref:hypothetical protein n=1 Tax=Nocardia sp. NPDC024068 TaxID=3157197 RepID=UPI0033E884D6
MGEQHSEYERERDIPNWDDLALMIEQWRKRVVTLETLDIAPGSSMAGDDRASAPWRVSHSVDSNIDVAVDALHAVKSLVHDQQILHTVAPYVLVRGALETLAAAYWILHPHSRDTRITRALRWYTKNFRDQANALSAREDLGYDGIERRLALVTGVASRRGLDPNEATRRLTSTAMVEDTDTHGPVPNVMYMWQLCSGYAHGRPWVVLGHSEQEILESREPGLVSMRVSAKRDNVSVAVGTAVWLLHEVGYLRQERSSIQY